jgi:hypothetical protein
MLCIYVGVTTGCVPWTLDKHNDHDVCHEKLKEDNFILYRISDVMY